MANLLVRSPESAVVPDVRNCLRDSLRHPLPFIRETGLLALQTCLNSNAKVMVTDPTSPPSATRELPTSHGDDVDHSVFVGLVQELFDQIRQLLFDSATDEDESGLFGTTDLLGFPLRLPPGGTRVRAAALSLLTTILHHGAMDPDSCVGPLIALETDAEPVISDLAHKSLLELGT